MKPTTLFLDVGGVLLTNGWDHKSRQLAAQTFNLDLPEMESRHNLTFDTYEIGKLPLSEYLNRIVFYTPRAFSQEQFIQFMYDQSQPYQEMIELIASLKSSHHLKIAVVSNEGRELTAHRIKQFKLNSLVDFFISSCFVHLRKPDEEIYHMALDIAQVQKEQVLYIDDRLLFVQVAQGLGIPSYQHTTYEATKAHLASIGLVAKK